MKISTFKQWDKKAAVRESGIGCELNGPCYARTKGGKHYIWSFRDWPNYRAPYKDREVWHSIKYSDILKLMAEYGEVMDVCFGFENIGYALKAETSVIITFKDKINVTIGGSSASADEFIFVEDLE